MEIAKGMFGILQKQIQATDWRHNGDTLSSYIGWGVLTSGSTTLKRFNLFLWSKSCHQGDLYNLFHTQEKTDSHALAQSLTGKRWEGAWSRPSLIYKSWITDPATERKNCLDSAKNLEDIVYGSWSMVLHTVTHFCESFGSLWRLVGLSQDLNSLSLVWIEYSTSVKLIFYIISCSINSKMWLDNWIAEDVEKDLEALDQNESRCHRMWWKMRFLVTSPFERPLKKATTQVSSRTSQQRGYWSLRAKPDSYK